MKNEYDALNLATIDLEGLDDSPLSPSELNALKKRLGRQGMPFPSRSPGRPLLALGLAAALAAGLFTVGAAGRLDWGEALTNALGMTQDRAQELGLPGESLALTETNGDSSITLEGVIGSGRTYYFPFTVTGPEGSVLGGPEGCSFDEAYVLFEDSGSSACTLRPLEDPDPTDNQLSFVLEAVTDQDVGGGKASLHLRNLFAYPAAGGQYHDDTAQVKGSFEFTFRLPQADTSTLLFESPEGLDLGLAAPLTRLNLSPLCLELELTGSGDGSRSLLDGVEAALLFKDGTRQFIVGTDAAGENAAHLYGAGERILCSFAHLVDTDTLEGVELNGQFFPLPQN